MSPVPVNSLSSVANFGLKQQASELPVFHNWQSPLPPYFSELDNRRHLLQAKNKFLEMHPSGVRAVDKKTKYCILMIMFLNLSTLASDNPMFPKDTRWGAAGADAQASRGTIAAPLQKIHVIISYETRQFLCMDDRSVVYQSSEYNASQCAFQHEMDSEYTDRYSRKLNESTPAWYLGINKDGSIRCGNVTRKNQDSAKFNRMAVDQTESSSSPPFITPKKECCSKTRCKNKSDSGENVKNESKKCRRLRTRCKKQRRMVFKLSLKQLKKYYNKCVDSNSDFMKECRNKSKSKSKTRDRKRQRNRRRHRTDANPR